MFYHASNIEGLKTLIPKVSTHGKAYVYAINNKITAVCFGAPKDDFDLLMDEKDGITYLYECYPNALEKIYKEKNCSLYCVDSNRFISGKTGWDAEWVCEDEVPVEEEERIEDIYSYLCKAAEEGECSIHYFSDNPDYLAMLREEFTERVKAFGLTVSEVQNDKRLKAILEVE